MRCSDVNRRKGVKEGPPQSWRAVNGWVATQATWQSLFPGIVVILCFLHAFLKIRDRAKRLASVFPDVAQKLWDAYQQSSYEAFIDKLTVLQLWAEQYHKQLSQAVLDAIHKLCRNAHSFSLAYDHPGCRPPAICSTAIWTSWSATCTASGTSMVISPQPRGVSEAQ